MSDIFKKGSIKRRGEISEYIIFDSPTDDIFSFAISRSSIKISSIGGVIGGWGCGYVAIKESYAEDVLKWNDDTCFQVHGGITYYVPCDKFKHFDIPELINTGECVVMGLHYGDTINNCDFDYVARQTKYLKEQIKNLPLLKRTKIKQCIF